ncbi:MAG: histidine kinase [Sulfurimonas sp. RIFOXYD12_FULL_33_39]|uniref:HDOD domain-containing protein n=1 Tax=unclassified Sulfurimonas TaxID=2623549 RepID=UPI0008AFC150|nr:MULTISPECIES: HDOD domain-containing protein [unclassified Sulfurimonas]OHE05443.1 MAG: histidine kinase [Sulfurimonas sp. RIFCSPLOWO2_12_FULL_34_6]OHE08703.1 MAG: histidine kinase [Sulfurimonas sp. RIFOXYD12_FULL_33_39]OHE13988.1 MAG: histidine kinase [Sulfurimonas sp. RIFOXYD2_FULL_34_21]DAB27602.1 MAG TPA: histidine kinase [Sulfurimonas sp. UBA10385]
MITKDKIESFIEKIPPSPKILKETISLLNVGELTKAAKVAEGDLALKAYLKNIVNKPIYGFKNEVSDISQIFGILGVSLSQQTLYNYMISLLSPNKWVLFKLNAKLFHELQANLSKKWETILKHLKIDDKNIYAAISLLPASIIVTEALFVQKIDDVNLLRTTKALDFNTILIRLCGVSLFDVCEQIAQKWEMDSKISQIVQASSGVKPSDNKEINQLGKWMHLLLFYELSKPAFIEARLNDFVDFQIEYIEDIYNEFASLMEIQ